MPHVFHPKATAVRACGFTLIELIVVISLIMLLVAILLPTLSNARRAAVDVQCKANLRSMGQATATYAVDYDDGMPLNTRTSLWNFYFLRGASYLSATNPGYINLGLLYPEGYNHAAESYFCPFQKMAPWVYNPATFMKTAAEAPGHTGNTSGGYNYWLRSDRSPVRRLIYGGSGNDYTTRLSEYGRHAFASDLTYADNGNWTHVSGGKKAANVLSTDGSVRLFVDAEDQVHYLRPYTTESAIQQVFILFDQTFN